MEKDKNFENIQAICDFLTTFATNTRYPHKYEITENDAEFSIKAVEKIRDSKPIADLIKGVS